MSIIAQLFMTAALLGGMPFAVYAAGDAAAHAGHQAIAPLDRNTTAGVVLKVDAAAQKVTIQHGEIKSMNMPPMTMPYTVSRPAMLKSVKVGDKVRFEASLESGQYLVTRLDVQR